MVGAALLHGDDADRAGRRRRLDPLAEQHGDRVRLFARRAAGRPDSNFIAVDSFRDQRVDGCAFQLLPRLGVAEEAGLVRLFGGDSESFQQFIRRDFEAVIRESKESGGLDLEMGETELLANVFTLSELRVKDCLVPRTDIEAVEEAETLEEVRARFIESGYSKLPVYRDNIDSIVGVVFAHDLFLYPKSLAEITRPIMAVPESKAANGLLREFLASNTSIAVAIDEYGGTAGLITIEDLLEELFGDIQDEFDTDDALLSAGLGFTVMDGLLRIDVARAAGGYMAAQMEPGHCCPITMFTSPIGKMHVRSR